MISPGARGGTLARMAIVCGQAGAGTDRGDKSSDQFAWSAKVIALTEVGLLSHLLALIAYVGLFFAALSKQRRGINLGWPVPPL